MKLEELYKNAITRPLNPAVSVTDTSASTIKVEIEEYVFTDEILNGLYNVLNAVRERRVSHTGIWINGYYGSGKSHLLKYLNFCLSPVYRDEALQRMLDAVKSDFDPLKNEESKLEADLRSFEDLVKWLKSAEIDTILFNIGDKVGDSKMSFAKALWEEFNAFRGFHKFNLALAQYLEKPLEEIGKYEAFKDVLKEENFDWKTQAEELVITKLDLVLKTVAKVAPFSTDIIRNRIESDSLEATPERLSEELKKYISTKGEKYRLLFFIDEVSQFVGSRQELLLQLQQIVTTIAKDCEKKVWVGCTAQQDLSEVLNTCNIVSTTDQYGKILGRFETRVSLKGTKTEYITQKRILEKDEDAVVELGKVYDTNKNALESQFDLPTGYHRYSSRENFIDYYPFVPYQFQLIMDVFDAFVAKSYVDTEVKGNERSVLKITHKTAQDKKDEEVGELISFDMMFSSMFEAGLKHEGQRAIKNANTIIATYKERAFGQRVVNLLFMLCNISDNVKQLFPATLDNIVTLMMTEIDQGKLELKEKIEKVLEYLVDKSVVRVESKEGKADVYCFLTEEESEVNSLIMNQSPNANAVVNALRGIITKYISFNNRETFNNNPLTIGLSINDRYIMGQSNANVLVEFKTDANHTNIQQFAMEVEKKKMVFFLANLYQANAKLRNEFYWYCKVQEYMSQYASNASEQRTKTNNEFRTRAAELLNKSIYPEFVKIMDSCPVVSGQNEIPAGLFASKRGTERYKAAFAEHCRNLYPYATYVNGSDVPATADALKQKIVRPIQQNEYSAINTLTQAEQEIENRLNRQTGDMVLGDILSSFSQPPYGWNEIATAYYVNELVRRHKRGFAYKGNEIADRKRVAEIILKERNSFTVTSGRQISQQLLQEFTKAWKEIFQAFNEEFPIDSEELYDACRTNDDSRLKKLLSEWPIIAAELRANNAEQLAEEIESDLETFRRWYEERDHEKFFKLIVAEKDEGKAIMDRCAAIIQFRNGPQMKAFNEMYKFADDNRDNFDFIEDEEGKRYVVELREIFKEKDPINKLPKYKKRVDALKKRLAETIKEKRVKKRALYEEALENIQQFADTVSVCFDKSEFANYIEAKCTTDNLYALDNETDVETFKKAKMTEIEAKVKPSEATGEAGENKAKPKRVKRFGLKELCKSSKITNEEEIDAYVETIRERLKDALKDNDEIVVM